MPKFKKEAQEELIEERLKLQEAKQHRHRGHRRRGQAHHEGHGRAQQDDGGAVRRSTSRAWASTSPPCASASGRRLRGATSSGAFGRRSPSPSATSTACCRRRPAKPERTRSSCRCRRSRLPMPAKLDQNAHGQALCARPRPCAASSAAARAWQAWPRTPAGARFDDLKFIKPSSFPSRRARMLLSAKDGEMLPPATRRDRHRALRRVRPARDQGRREAAREGAGGAAAEGIRDRRQAPPGDLGRTRTSSTAERGDDRLAARAAGRLERAMPLAVTMGDPAGIGPDITLASWLRAQRTRPAALRALRRPGRARSERARALGLAVPIADDRHACARRRRRSRDALPGPAACRIGAGDGADAAVVARHRGGDRGRAARRRAGARHQPDRQAARSTCAGFAYPGHTEFLAALAVRHQRGRHAPPGDDAGGGRAEGRAGHRAHPAVGGAAARSRAR